MRLFEQIVDMVAVPRGRQFFTTGNDIRFVDGKLILPLLQTDFAEDGDVQRQLPAESPDLYNRKVQRIIAAVQGDEMLAIGIPACKARLHFHFLKMADLFVKKSGKDTLDRMIAQEK